MSRHPDLDDLLEEFRARGGGARRRTLRVLGGKLGQRGAPFHRESLVFEDDVEGPQTIDLVETRTCSFGHTVDDQVRVAGICEIGGEVLCSTEGCLRHCRHCGAVVCRRHSRTYGELTYCTRCRWHHYWRRFWGIE
jgi:hypothetical protein